MGKTEDPLVMIVAAAGLVTVALTLILLAATRPTMPPVPYGTIYIQADTGCRWEMTRDGLQPVILDGAHDCRVGARWEVEP